MKKLKSNSQTLITGVYRSGTEYLTLLINSHPLISASMYRINLLRFAYKKGHSIHLPKNYKKILNDLNKRLKYRYKIKLNLKNIYNYIKNKKIKVTYGNLYDIIMSSIYLKGSVKHWAEKNQLLWREIPEFIKIMPNGKAIVVVRDPRSVLASFKKFTNAKKPLYLQAIFNCFDLFLFIEKNKKLIKNKRLYVVKYENVALNPKYEINKIFKFLKVRKLDEVSIVPNQLDAYGNIWRNNTVFDKSSNSKKFHIKSSINRWKSNLKNEEIILTEIVCARFMNKFGYKCKYKSLNKKIPKKVLELFKYNNEIKTCFKNYLEKSEGIQKFPSDPLKRKNWTKIKV